MGFAYSKLQFRLSHKGYDIRAKELGSFACGYLVKIANVNVVGDWHIEVHTTGRFFRRSLVPEPPSGPTLGRQGFQERRSPGNPAR